MRKIESLGIQIAGFTVYDLILFFVIYAFMGWVVESVYNSWLEKRLVNRGFLSGPFCPIYGFGMVILLMVLNPWQNNLLVVFTVSLIFTSTLEYLTGWGMEKIFKNKWWDYSDRPFNLQGRICLQFSLYWGCGALVMLKIIHPLVAQLIDHLPQEIGIYLIFALGIYFGLDFVQAIRSALETKDIIVQLHLFRMEAHEKLDYLKELSHEAVDEVIAGLRTRHEQILFEASFGARRLFDAFPNLKSNHFEKIFEEIKYRINHTLERGNRFLN